MLQINTRQVPAALHARGDEPTDGLVAKFDIHHAEYASIRDDEELVRTVTLRLERLIDRILGACLLPTSEEHDELFDLDKPLHAMRAKIHLAHRLGLISGGLRDELLILRNIRKVFTENIDCVALEYRDTRSSCQRLAAPPKLLQKAESPLYRDWFSDHPRGRYELAAVLTTTLLESILERASLRPREPLH